MTHELIFIKNEYIIKKNFFYNLNAYYCFEKKNVNNIIYYVINYLIKKPIEQENIQCFNLIKIFILRIINMYSNISNIAHFNIIQHLFLIYITKLCFNIITYVICLHNYLSIIYH